MIEKDKPGPSDNASFDVHATDPARLKSEIKKDLGLKKPKLKGTK